jgi:hypothetical protein
MKPKLDLRVIAELNRLGIPTNTTTISDQYTAQTPCGPRSVPEPLRELLGYDWSAVELNGTVGRHSIWMLELGISGELYQSHLSKAYWMIGGYDGGNYMVLVELDDRDPTDPQIYIVDHDTSDEDSDPSRALGPASRMLAGLLAFPRSVRVTMQSLRATLARSLLDMDSDLTRSVADIFVRLRSEIATAKDPRCNAWLIDEVDSIVTQHITTTADIDAAVRAEHDIFCRSKLMLPPLVQPGKYCFALALNNTLNGEIDELRVAGVLAAFPADCDCRALIEVERWRQPKSPALVVEGAHSDGYYIGDSYRCNACGTRWFQAIRDDDSGGYFWEVINSG